MTLVISAGVAQPGSGGADQQRNLATLANAARLARETKSPPTSPSERPIAPAK
jgi:hypothetical protein